MSVQNKKKSWYVIIGITLLPCEVWRVSPSEFSVTDGKPPGSLAFRANIISHCRRLINHIFSRFSHFILSHLITFSLFKALITPFTAVLKSFPFKAPPHQISFMQFPD